MSYMDTFIAIIMYCQGYFSCLLVKNIVYKQISTTSLSCFVIEIALVLSIINVEHYDGFGSCIHLLLP